MSDLISRQKVLNTLDFADNALTDEDRTVEKYKELLIECIKVLPSDENKGEWFAITQPWADTQIFQCTCCGRHIEVPQYGVSTLTIRYPFCHCGADMRGEHE